MKYSVAVMLLIGAISTADALTISQRNAGFLQADNGIEAYNNEVQEADK